MASHASPETDEDPALVSRLSQPFSDTPDKRTPRPYHAQSASASSATRPSTPPSDKEMNLTLASGISQRSSGAAEEQGQSVASQPIWLLPTPIKLHHNTNFMILIGLISSGLPADISDEQIGEPSRYGESSVTNPNNPAWAGTEVWMVLPLRNLDH
jgi:hypothetical protein